MCWIYIFVIFGLLCCSASQILLKVSAKKRYSHKIFEFVNPMVILSYGILFGSLLINIWAMGKGLQLKEMAMLESLGYIFVPLLSLIFLKEVISKRTLVAIFLINLGIFVFYL